MSFRDPHSPHPTDDRAGAEERSDLLLAEQIAYYRARAGEYDSGALDLPGGEEVVAALESFRPTGDVLELACGPGTWTSDLLRPASTTRIERPRSWSRAKGRRRFVAASATAPPIAQSRSPIPRRNSRSD